MPANFEATPLEEAHFRKWAHDGDIIVATMASGMIVPMYGPSCEKPWTYAAPVDQKGSLERLHKPTAAASTA